MKVVVVGAGQAGFQVAASLRDRGFTGEVTIVGDESYFPYQRPPLSKAYMSGVATPETLAFRPAGYYAEHLIDIKVAQRVEALDRDSLQLIMEDGGRLAYDHLVLATGARCRLLSAAGVELSGIFYLRGLADADEIRAAIGTARHVAVIGAGFIGLEFAAVAASKGLSVTVFEAAGRLMARAVSPAVSAFVQATHERSGIRFELDAVVGAFAGRDGRVTGIITLDGRRADADLVLVGIGVVPNEELATASGLPVANGIMVDAELLTPDRAISAIGDCASHPSLYSPEPVRIESVQNAVDQARCVASRLLGRPVRYDSVPWFWSDQGTLKIQMAGLPAKADAHVQRGNPEDGAFSVFSFVGERLSSVESINRPADHMVARRLIKTGASITAAEVSDPRVDLRARSELLSC